MVYIVKSVVCDYGVFEKTEHGEKLMVICNLLSNAELIADILNTDIKNTKYDVIGTYKVDKAVEEIKNLRMHYPNEDFYDCKHEVLEILKRNIGE